MSTSWGSPGFGHDKAADRRRVEGYLRKNRWVKATRHNSPLYWEGLIAAQTCSYAELEQLHREFVALMEIHGKPPWLDSTHPLAQELRKNLGYG